MHLMGAVRLKLFESLIPFIHFLGRNIRSYQSGVVGEKSVFFIITRRGGFVVFLLAGQMFWVAIPFLKFPKVVLIFE